MPELARIRLTFQNSEANMGTTIPQLPNGRSSAVAALLATLVRKCDGDGERDELNL